MAWPDPPLYDDFNRANESPVGAPKWISPGGSGQPLNLVSNQLISSVNTICVSLTSQSWKIPMSAALAIGNVPNGINVEFTVGVCSDLITAKCYQLQVGIAGSSPWIFSNFDIRRSDTPTGGWVEQPDIGSLPLPAIPQTGDLIGISVYETTVEAWYFAVGDEWTLCHTSDDAALSSLPYTRQGGRAFAQLNETTLNPLAGTLDNFYVTGEPISALRDRTATYASAIIPQSQPAEGQDGGIHLI